MLSSEVFYNEDLKIMSIEDISKAMEITDKCSNLMSFDPKEKLFLKLATEEACMNAYEYCVKHGHLSIKVCWNVNEDGLTINIVHKGEVFPIERKDKDEVNVGLRGRGLQIIQNIMDNVCVNQREEKVCFSMLKYKSDKKGGNGHEHYPKGIK